MADGPFVVTVEVDAGDDPISGRVRAGTGPATAFVGWLQLISGLQESVEDVRRAGDERVEGQQ